MRKAETAQINNVVPSGFHAYALLTNGQLHMFFVNSGQFNINIESFVVVVDAHYRCHDSNVLLVIAKHISSKKNSAQHYLMA
jgi:hypothetical protein